MQLAPLPILNFRTHFSVKIGHSFGKTFGDDVVEAFHLSSIRIVKPGALILSNQISHGIEYHIIIFQVLPIELLSEPFFKSVFYHFIDGGVKDGRGDILRSGYKVPSLKGCQRLLLLLRKCFCR